MTGRRLSERYSAELASADVHDFTSSLIAHEANWRVSGLQGWPLAIARNQWFQSRAARAVSAINAPAGTAVLAHSYAALEIFRVAKAKRLTTVLAQIDPGEAHFRILRDVAECWPEFGPALSEPSPDYFSAWREECRLADRIIVNSEWSRNLLTQVLGDDTKINVIPLSYEVEAGDAAFERRYPAAFTPERPLRVLFIGSVATFKGVPELLESLDRLKGSAIELRIVGPMAATIPQRFLDDQRVKWIGSVSRSSVMDYCRDSDVLVFPSHSDGFGMAQVEAQAWRLPIIASRSCGRVVEDGINGLLLPEVSGDAIAAALRRMFDPEFIARLAVPARQARMTLDKFGAVLSGLVSND
jgi:glycosyltransferase involved in cell wall biosynthesis